MYYVIECDFPLNENGEALMEIHNCFRAGTVRNWKDGQPFKPDAIIPDPIEIDFEPLHDYQGEPVEMVDTCIPVMSKKLRVALDCAGVGNIVYFPAILKNRITGRTYEYYAYKILGIVAAANLDQSEYISFDGDAFMDAGIEKLVIDEKKANGMLVFRLAENVSTLMVHENIKMYLEKAGIDTLSFIRSEEYVQL